MRPHIRPWTAVTVLTGLTLVLIAFAVTFLLWDLRKRETEHARLESTHLARMLVEQMEQSFSGAALVLQGVEERLESGFGSRLALDGPAVHLLLSTRAAGLPQLRSLFVVNAQGRTVNTSRDTPVSGVSVADRDYFRTLAAGGKEELFIGRPERGRVDHSWTLHLARRLSGADGQFRGVVVAAISLERFEQFYSNMKLDFARPVALYLGDGTLAASLPHREEDMGRRAPELARGMPELPPGRIVYVDGMGGGRGGGGGKNSLVLGRVRGFPFIVGVTNAQEQALAEWRETAVPITLGAGLVSLFIAFAAIVLGRELRKEAGLTRALREADDRYQRTMDSVMDAIVAVDESQHILLFNPAAERMFGLSAREAVGAPLEKLIPERLRHGHRRHMETFMASGEPARTMPGDGHILGQRADGSEFPVESTISQTLIGGLRQYTVVLRDVTERRRAEDELRELTRQLRKLSASLQEVKEQERSRIARELHDELGQQLTGLKLDLSWLNSRLKEGRPVPPEKVDAMRHLLDRAIGSVRRISTELHPLILDDLGFGEAVSWQAEEFGKRSGIQTVLDLSAADRVSDKAQATALYRIVQESLTNVLRHAKATRVDIRLRAEGDGLVLSVKDNGQGMSREPRPGGIGLVSMRERATALGGRFSIMSTAGVGTTIEVVLPVKEAIVAGEER